MRMPVRYKVTELADARSERYVAGSGAGCAGRRAASCGGGAVRLTPPPVWVHYRYRL